MTNEEYISFFLDEIRYVSTSPLYLKHQKLQNLFWYIKIIIYLSRNKNFPSERLINKWAESGTVLYPPPKSLKLKI